MPPRREPHAFVIEGEAGAGKTSIWESALAAAAERGRSLLAARPAEAEASFAYAALGDLLRRARGCARRLASRQRRALEVALILDDQGGAARTSRPSHWGWSACSGGWPRAARSWSRWMTCSGWTPPRSWCCASQHAGCGRMRVGVLVAWRTEGGEPVPLELEPGQARRLERLAAAAAEPGRRAAPAPGAARLSSVAPRTETPARPVRRQSVLRPRAGPRAARGHAELEPGERLPVALEALVGARLGALSEDARRTLAAAAAMAQPTRRARGGRGRRRPRCARRGGARAGRQRAGRADPLRAPAAGLRRVRGRGPVAASRAPRSRRRRARPTLRSAPGTWLWRPRVPTRRWRARSKTAARRAEARGAPPAAAELYERAVRLTPAGAERDALRRTMHAGFCAFQTGDGRRARELLDGWWPRSGPDPIAREP